VDLGIKQRGDGTRGSASL